MLLAQVTASALTVAKRLWQAWVVIILLALGGRLLTGSSYRTLDMLNVLLLFLAIVALSISIALRLVLWLKDRKARNRNDAEHSEAHNSDANH